MMAMRISMELTMEMRYKIRMIAVPIDGKAQILGYNESMVITWSIKYSTFKKKHNHIEYHQVMAYVAVGVISLAHIPGKSYPADIMTKPLGPQ